MEEVPVKRKRGRPRKSEQKPVIQQEVKQVEESVKQQVEEQVISSEHPKIVTNQPISNWDVRIGEKIEYFDTDLSYEITGYKPINKTRGLDFDPDWFTEARETFLRTGHYTEYRYGSKAFAEFWDLQYKRCREGMVSHGYRITGDNYFFLNFFQLLDLDIKGKAGGGRQYIFPAFYAGQYEIFHYIELCRALKLNACIMKSREINIAVSILQ